MSGRNLRFLTIDHGSSDDDCTRAFYLSRSRDVRIFSILSTRSKIIKRVNIYPSSGSEMRYSADRFSNCRQRPGCQSLLLTGTSEAFRQRIIAPPAQDRPGILPAVSYFSYVYIRLVSSLPRPIPDVERNTHERSFSSPALYTRRSPPIGTRRTKREDGSRRRSAARRCEARQDETRRDEAR